MLCDTAGVGGEGVLHLSTGSPFGHHPRLSMGCPRRGQWVSAQKYSAYYRPHVSHVVLRILSLSYHLTLAPHTVYNLADTLHSLHRLPLSSHIVYGLADTLTHCIAYHRPHIPYIVLRILSLTASPTTVTTYRI